MTHKIDPYILEVLIAILLVILVVFMALSIRPINHCSACGKAYWGKQEAINNKPACDECHEKWYVNNYSKNYIETRGKR